MLNSLKNIFSKILIPNNKTEKSKKQFSLKDLKQLGLTIEPTAQKIVNKENLIYASQLPIHVLPWMALLKDGMYQITFSPEVQSQINSGILNVTGGVARNKSGHIVAHGMGINPLIATPLILYQVGVIAFGAIHLQKINKSLKKIDEKLNKIYGFQLDKRSAQINSHFQEFLHISEGIMEFSKLGNVVEVLNRIDMIKHIRLVNLTNLLHLQKNLQNKTNSLQKLKKSFSFTSKEKYNALLELIESYERDLIDYKHSLFLDIICTKTEASFSVCKSYMETKSRLLSQKSQLDFFKKQLSSFKRNLNRKTSELKGIFNTEETLKTRKKNIKEYFKKAIEVIADFDKLCINHIQSTEDAILSKDKVIFLHKANLLSKSNKLTSQKSELDQSQKVA